LSIYIFRLVITSSVRRITASDYHFAIFNLFLLFISDTSRRQLRIFF